MSFFLKMITSGKRLDAFLDSIPLISILGKLSKLSILAGAIVYLVTWSSVQKQKLETIHYQAWQIINSAIGQTANGGRVLAMEKLARDGISLRGVNLRNAWIQYMNVDYADMSYSVLVDAKIFSSDLKGIDLSYSNAKKAVFGDSDLIDANFDGADLTGASFIRSKIDGSSFIGAKGLTCSQLKAAESAKNIKLGSLLCK